MSRNPKAPAHTEFVWFPLRGMETLEPAPGRGYWQSAEFVGELNMPSATEEQWRAKQKAQGDANRRKADHTASIIRELKASPSPEREREIIAELRANLGDDYINGLTSALREAAAKPGPKRPTNGGKSWR